eukprot:6951598-Alexandrium_andersonii.AAC.1
MHYFEHPWDSFSLVVEDVASVQVRAQIHAGARYDGDGGRVGGSVGPKFLASDISCLSLMS